MIKKISLITGALLLASTAYAEPLINGPYVTLRLGAENAHFKADGEKEHDTTIAFLPAVGIRVKAFRAEFEWANIARVKPHDASYHQQRYMAQFYYEVPFRSKFRPYLNAGLGASYLESTYRRRHVRKSADDTTLAWNAGAGITFNWTRSLSFDLGYRYINGGKAKLYDDVEVKVQDHEGYFGVRLTF